MPGGGGTREQERAQAGIQGSGHVCRGLREAATRTQLGNAALNPQPTIVKPDGRILTLACKHVCRRWGDNERGVSFTFGADVVQKFLHKHDLDLVCRAHQVVEDGYEFFAKRQLVTLFSAPNYCGEFDNAGAMMSVDDTLMCSFQVLPAVCVLCVCVGGKRTRSWPSVVWIRGLLTGVVWSVVSELHPRPLGGECSVIYASLCVRGRI